MKEDFVERVSEKGEVGHEVGVFASGFIFKQTGVFAPMVAIFDTRPMTADELEPLFG